MDAEIEKAKEEMAKTARETAMQQTGACVYNAGGKTYCAVVTSNVCSGLGGRWFPDKSC